MFVVHCGTYGSVKASQLTTDRRFPLSKLGVDTRLE